MPEKSGNDVVHDSLVEQLADQHTEDDDRDGHHQTGQRYRLHLLGKNVGEVDGF